MEPGSILAGRYKVGETLGRGGMGIVVEATHIQLGTPVAIKMLRKDALEEPDLIERFLREARSAARLRGEHVCRVTDFGTTDEGIPFMVMELLVGEDLKSVLDTSGALDVSQTATVILQACIAVGEAHSIGLIHRDLKPGNLFLIKRADGRRFVKLVDFGIAKSTTTIDQSLTATTKAMGSPAYMSPEQLRSSGNVDPRSDIWSLGVTMFELLTEKRPFEGDTPYELAVTITNDPPAKLPDTVPADFARVVMRCIDKDRERRYRDVAELATALAPFSKHGKELAAEVRSALVLAEPRPSTARDRLDTPNPATETTMRGASGAIASGARMRTRSMIAIPLLIAGLLAIGAGGYMYAQGGDSVEPATTRVEPPPPPPSPAVDAAPAPVVPAAIDAAVVVEPDAAEAPAVEPAPAVKPIKKKPLKKQPRPLPDDPDKLGRSRF